MKENNIKFKFIRGFTLSELLLASAILVFAVSSILLLFINCIFMNECNRNLSLATSHAQFVMEEIKNTEFIGLKTEIDQGDWDWDTTTIESKGLTALRDESIDTNATGTDPLNITVKIEWKARSNRQRNIELRTLITDY